MILKFLQIDRLNTLIVIIILLISYSSVGYSQDLYDRGNSEKYADYLFSSHQFPLAAEEYERLIYFDSANVNFKCRLVRSYRLSGNVATGISRVYSFYTNSIYKMPESLSREFIVMQLLSDSIQVVNDFAEKSSLPEADKVTYRGLGTLLKGDYMEADDYLNDALSRGVMLPSGIMSLSEKAMNTRMKSPFLAAGFSAIIPGTGKFYTKNWTDGIMSILFIAGNTWQAYRGFSETGVKSAYGWIFTGVSASFYIGNIFGSAKAAKRYNRRKKNEIDKQIYEFVHSDSF